MSKLTIAGTIAVTVIGAAYAFGVRLLNRAFFHENPGPLAPRGWTG